MNKEKYYTLPTIRKVRRRIRRQIRKVHLFDVGIHTTIIYKDIYGSNILKSRRIKNRIYGSKKL